MQSLDLEGGPARWPGAFDFDRSADGLAPRRLPDWTRPQVPAFMELMVRQPSGVRIVFDSDTRNVELEVLTTVIEMRGRARVARFDLVVDGVLHASAQAHGGNVLRVDLARPNHPEFVPGAVTTLRFDDLPAGDKRIELWLPSGRRPRCVRCVWTTAPASGQRPTAAAAGCTTAARSATAPRRTVRRAPGRQWRRDWPTWH